MLRTRLRAYIAATHFPQALTMVLLSTMSSWVLGQRSFVLIFVFIAVAAGQASIGWVNDRQDAKIDSALNRAEKPLVGDSLRPSDLVRPIQIATVIRVRLVQPVRVRLIQVATNYTSFRHWTIIVCLHCIKFDKAHTG